VPLKIKINKTNIMKTKIIIKDIFGLKKFPSLHDALLLLLSNFKQIVYPALSLPRNKTITTAVCLHFA